MRSIGGQPPFLDYNWPAQRPSLLLMDEPLSSLDKARREKIMLVTERIRDELKLPSSTSAMTAQRWSSSLTS
jgi:ABC-type cobalamin/Fe3+-siderophores transport system ATPase subunit